MSHFPLPGRTLPPKAYVHSQQNTWSVMPRLAKALTSRTLPLQHRTKLTGACPQVASNGTLVTGRQVDDSVRVIEHLPPSA